MNSRKSVYIAYTGGTIGMRRGNHGYRPAPGWLEKQMQRMPELADPRMPRYEIHEYDPLLDSSNMAPADWAHIGRDIVRHYERFDGFLVLHGTDTMAYSAAALSFMLAGLAKPVIFTGSQIPLEEVRNDARDNLITSLLIAAHQTLPEVCLFFGERLLRGNRATKTSTIGLNAFDSPNLPPLGSAGVEIQIEHSLVRSPQPGPLRFTEVGQPAVANVHLFPGISPDTMRQFLRAPIRGAVLHTFGAGNAPNNSDFLAVLRQASEHGVVLVNCTQCLRGRVNMESYATGRALRDAGVVSGWDMTPEAALTKLFYLLSQDLEPDAVRQQMANDLRGELSRPEGG